MARLGRSQPFKPLIQGFNHYAASTTLSPSLFQETNIFYSPSVTTGAVVLTPGLFQETNIFYGPTVSVGAVTLTASLFQETNIFYAPTVTQDGAQTLTPDLFQNTTIFYSPIVANVDVTTFPGTVIGARTGEGALPPWPLDKKKKKKKRKDIVQEIDVRVGSKPFPIIPNVVQEQRHKAIQKGVASVRTAIAAEKAARVQRKVILQVLPAAVEVKLSAQQRQDEEDIQAIISFL